MKKCGDFGLEFTVRADPAGHVARIDIDPTDC